LIDFCKGNNIVDESEGSEDDDPSWWDDGDILMAFDLGFDEGGSGDTLLVSVQVGITEQAKRLKRRWKSRIKPLPYFHSKDFNNYAGGIFTDHGLNRVVRTKLLNDLAKYIHLHLLFGITARVSISEYDKLTTQKFKSRYGTAYAFVVDMCLLAAHSKILEANLAGGYNILVEDGHRNSSQVAQILKQFHDAPEEQILGMKILTSGLGSKKDHPILQASDMLVYSGWQSINLSSDTIWNAVHDDPRYNCFRVDCGPDLIMEFVNGAKPSTFLKAGGQ
jgi:hypothetical protein